MIKNIIFDVGMVLVDFSWEKKFEKLGLSGDVFEAVADATVRSRLWDEYDRSTLSDEEILEGFVANAPEYEREIRLVWDNVGDMITCYPYSLEWIRSYKERGFHCYVLSNYPKRTYELTKQELSFTEEMDGAIFSYEVQCVKPEPEIFHALMDRFGLRKEECVFFDDNKKNVAGALEFGIETIHFRTRDQAAEELEELIRAKGN